MRFCYIIRFGITSVLFLGGSVSLIHLYSLISTHAPSDPSVVAGVGARSVASFVSVVVATVWEERLAASMVGVRAAVGPNIPVAIHRIHLGLESTTPGNGGRF